MSEGAQDMPKDVRLDYAPLYAARRRRRLRRVVLGVGLVGLIVAGVWFGPAVWRGARVMYAVRYAMGYDAPAGTVVYRDDPITWRPLLANLPAPSLPAASPATWAADPAPFTRLAAVSDPGYVTMFSRGGSGLSPGPLVFLHERTTPKGERLLVTVRLTGVTYYPWDGGTLACSYSALLLRTAEWRPPTGKALIRAWGGVHIPTASEANDWSPTKPDPGTPATPGEVRVFFGSADTADASRFTVPYEVNGKAKQWRFRLKDDGLELEEQKPATRPGGL
jgi:hypothetical protein